MLLIVELFRFNAATPGDLHEVVFGSVPPVFISDTVSLKSEATLPCVGRLSGEDTDPTGRPTELLWVKDPLFCDVIGSLPEILFNPVKVKLAGMSGFLMLPRRSESFGRGLNIFRGPLACRIAFSSGGKAFLPRFLGGSGLATTIWAFF